MRIGKTGSKSTILQLSRPDAAGCAQTAVFHDVLAAQLPPTQAKVTVMREPCDRASSLLRHLHEFAPRAHPVHAVHTLSEFARFLEARWANVTRTPWPENDAMLHHYIVAWPQSWYIDACTRVLCYTTPLRAPLQAFCEARRRGAGASAPRTGPPIAAGAQSAGGSEGCDHIRRLYKEDWDLYVRHCGGDRSDGPVSNGPKGVTFPSARARLACGTRETCLRWWRSNEPRLGASVIS